MIERTPGIRTGRNQGRGEPNRALSVGKPRKANLLPAHRSTAAARGDGGRENRTHGSEFLRSPLVPVAAWALGEKATGCADGRRTVGSRTQGISLDPSMPPLSRPDVPIVVIMVWAEIRSLNSLMNSLIACLLINHFRSLDGPLGSCMV